MGRHSLIPAWAACALLEASPARAGEVLRVTGTGTALGSMRLLAAAFEKAHPGAEVRVLRSLGSTGAVRAVSEGAIDVAVAGRDLKPPERDLGLLAMAYARTPYLLAVGPRAGVTGITAAEAVRMYRGDQTSWPNGERVRIVLRPRTDIDTTLLAAVSPDMAAAVDAAMAREGMLMAATNQDCHDILERTPGSIGPSSLTQMTTERAPLTPLAWNGVEPTLANLASGRYPLVKTLFLVVRAPPSPAVQRLVQFLSTPEAARILEETGNLPVPIPAVP